jgi:very-short-patch-repair endonuclease
MPIHFFDKKWILFAMSGNWSLKRMEVETKLVIEVDGESHFTEQGKAYDMERSAYLEGLGVRVLRFSNLELTANFEDVCKVIMAEILTL